MRNEIPYPRIRDMREDRDLRQIDVARHLNISQTCYSKYEIGTSDIPVSILIALADLYRVSIDYLLGQTSNQQRNT